MIMQVFLKNSKPSSLLTKKTGDYSWLKTDDTRVLVDADNATALVVVCVNSPYHGDTLNIFGTKKRPQYR